MPFPYEADDFYTPQMTIPDVIRKGVGMAHPAMSIQDLQVADQLDGTGQSFTAMLTTPGNRPEVQLRGLNYGLSVGTIPTPLTLARSSIDTIIVDNPSSALNSIFFGYGNSVTTSTGLEVRAGIPLVYQPVNTREPWELQRQLEFISMMMAAFFGMNSIPAYRAPRVIIDPSQYFTIATATTAISIMLLYIPEMQ